MKIYYRIYQQTYRIASYFVKWRTPEILKGEKRYDDLKEKLLDYKYILIVTDKSLVQLGLLKDLLDMLKLANKKYFIYDKTLANPTVANVEEALEMYIKNNCQSIIAFGGGSPIDCAKIVAARIACPKKSVKKMKGVQKIRKKLIPLFVIPTTAGTGSETTIAAVITDDNTHEKYAITDMCIIPQYAVFDPELTCKLPPLMTAATGMDALTHAIEAFIGKSNTKKTKLDALMSIKLIYENLYTVYLDGNNLKARKAMQYGSFYAGKAFTRAYVGNVHAIAHALGGLYNLPHGLMNAIVLPVVLRAYGDKIYKDLAIISDYIGISEFQDTQSQKAIKLISWIEQMNNDMKIPDKIKEIRTEDVPLMAQRAYREANPFYPVPEIWSREKFKDILIKLKGDLNV